MKEPVRQSFLYGAFILGASNMIVKILGAIYKIPLGNLLGGDGMGYIAAANNVYATLFVISTAGLPIAISKMVAVARERNQTQEIKKIFTVGRLSFIVIGLVAAAAMFFGAGTVVGWLTAPPEAVFSLMAIAPAVLFVAFESAYRGFYQGYSNMYPTAISQLIESVCKLFVGLGIAWILYKSGFAMEYVAAGAMLGVTLGTFLGAVYLSFTRKKFTAPPTPYDNLNSRRSREIFRELITIAIPITISASVLSITNLLDNAIVLRRLQYLGFTQESANWTYGAYNFAISIFSLPSSFIGTLGVSVIPAISAHLARRDRAGAGRTIEASMRIAAILALPAGAGIAVLAEPILRFLYPARLEEVAVAAPLLSMLGFGVLFMCIVSLTNAILQSIGKVNAPIISMVIGGIIKIVLNWTLVGNPEINIAGAPIGTVCCYTAITLVNIFFIQRAMAQNRPKLLRVFGKPLVCSLVMAAAAWAVFGLLSGFAGVSVGVLASIAIAACVYFILLFVIRGITKEDILLIPKGEKLIKLLKIR